MKNLLLSLKLFSLQLGTVFVFEEWLAHIMLVDYPNRMAEEKIELLILKLEVGAAAYGLQLLLMGFAAQE